VSEQEWLQIYRETVHPLYGYMAKRTGGDRALTEDIVQESYLRALDSWKHKIVPETPLAWLKCVARNILIDHLRRKKRDARTEADLPKDSGHRTAAAELESLEIFQAIHSLGRKKAGILEAFYFDGMTVREIAGQMGISERAVEGLLRRARRSLRSLLPDSRPDGGRDA
jgi:RNA polymerase sigma-70 factor (ECF subfamily)